MKFLIDDPARLQPRERSLLRYLQREYTPEIARDVLLPLLTQESPVSLRALDWTVVNWSKQHNVVCSALQPGRMTNIHNEYRMALGFWKRRLFDPFRRRQRVRVCIDSAVFDTTLGQANFVLWSYKSGTLGYVLSNIVLIEADMNRVAQRQKQQRRDAARKGMTRRRTELTSGPGSICAAIRSPITITF